MRFAKAGRGRTAAKIVGGTALVGAGLLAYARTQYVKAAPTMDQSSIPQYMKDVYDWAYVNPFNVGLLDSQITVEALLFGSAGGLEQEVIKRANAGDKAIMVAHAYGHLVAQVAEKVGPTGDFQVVDCTPVQVAHAAEKLKNMPWAKAKCADAMLPFLAPGETKFDFVYTFLLLHEVPDEWKGKIVDNMLTSVKPDGKVMWIGYHGKPYWWHPMRYIMPLVYWYLEPFAFTMWEKEIWTHASPELRKKFKWTKSTHGGNLYQMVLAEPVKNDAERQGSMDTKEDIEAPHFLKRRLIASGCLL